MTPVDLVIVEGFKRETHPKLEVHRPAFGKPLLCRDDPHIVAVASDAPLAGLAVPLLALDDAAAIAGSSWRIAASRRRDMAQLSDDCFAFGGDLLSIGAALALHRRASDAAARDRDRAAARRRAGASSPRRSLAPRDVPPHDNSAVDGYAVFFADLAADEQTVLPIGGRAAAGHPLGRAAQARRGDPHLHRRADAGRPRHRAHAGGLQRGGRARAHSRRHQARRQPAARRRGRQGRRDRADRRAAPAAAGDRVLPPRSASTSAAGLSAAARRHLLDRRRSARARASVCRAARSTTPTATCCTRCYRGLGARCDRSRHPAATAPWRSATRSPPRRAATT